MTVSRLTKAITLILAVQLLLSTVFVFSRMADGDEGFYLAAAQRVADGMTPYQDFFYPQAPLLPLVFAAIAGWGLTSLLLLRVLAMIAGLVLTYVSYRIVREHTEDEGAALWGMFLIALSGISLAWHSVFKPFAFVDLSLIVSFGFLLRAGTRRSSVGLNVFLAMLFLSLAINLRAIFLLLVPVYVYWLAKDAKARESGTLRLLLPFLFGLFIPSIPSIILLAKAPSSFWFDNLTFHLHRAPISPLSELVWQKVKVFGEFLALPQTILLLGALIGGWYLLKHRVVEAKVLYRRSLLLAAVICAIYLIPTPAHMQYFQEAVPYLIMAALPVFAYIHRSESLKPLRRSAAMLYVVGIVPFIWLFIVSPRPRDARCELSHLRSVVSEVQSRSSSNDTLLSEWAVYTALSDRPQLPGSEHVGFYFPLAVDRETYGRNHLLTNDDIVEALRQKRPKLVVIDYKVYPEWQSALDSNYRLASTIGETMLYERNHDTL